MMKNTVSDSSFLQDFHAGNELAFLIESILEGVGAWLKSFTSFFVSIKTSYGLNMLSSDEAVVEKWLGAKGLSFLIQDKLRV